MEGTLKILVKSAKQELGRRKCFDIVRDCISRRKLCLLPSGEKCPLCLKSIATLFCQKENNITCEEVSFVDLHHEHMPVNINFQNLQ